MEFYEDNNVMKNLVRKLLKNLYSGVVNMN